MPQIKQSAKRLKQSQKKAKKNKVIKDRIDYLMRQFKKAVDAKDKIKAEEWSRQIIKQVDKAAKKRIYKKNKAGRKKSKMMKALNKV